MTPAICATVSTSPFFMPPLRISYKDRQPITGYTDNSLDMDAFIKSVSYREKKELGNTGEETISRKLKGMFFEAKK